jgi:hypothetical protein
MSMSLQKTLVSEKHLAEGLTLKLWLTINVEQSPIIVAGTRIMTESNMEEQLILFLNTLIRNRVKLDVSWNKVLTDSV